MRKIGKNGETNGVHIVETESEIIRYVFNKKQLDFQMTLNVKDKVTIGCALRNPTFLQSVLI